MNSKSKAILTGEYYIQKRCFGGWKIIVQERFHNIDMLTGNQSPEIYRFRKAKIRDLIELKILNNLTLENRGE